MAEVWNVVRKIKRETSLDMTCKTHNNDALYLYKLPQVKVVEEKLGIKPSDQRFINSTPTADQLKTGAEMFIYLNICPGKLDADSTIDLEHWFKSWFLFYTDLFMNQSPDNIILTLNRLMKSNTQRYKSGMVIAEKQKVSLFWSSS